MIARTSAPFALALALAAVGCGLDDETPSGAVDFRPSPGGVLLDSSRIGDYPFSNLQVSGHPRLVRVHRICLRDTFLFRCLTHVVVSNGRLHGSDGVRSYEGADFVGSRWDLDVDSTDADPPEPDYDSSVSMVLNGLRVVGGLELVDLRVDLDSASGPLKDLIPGGGTQTLCPPDPARGGVTEAALVADVYVDPEDGSVADDLGNLHIACTAGATGRAATLGYLPTTIGTAGYEAALRALRADYCGDGTSHAAVGDPFLLADRWGIQTAQSPASEARWTDAGALCLDRVRHPGADVAAIRQACGIPTCSGPNTNALLWTSL